MQSSYVAPGSMRADLTPATLVLFHPCALQVTPLYLWEPVSVKSDLGYRRQGGALVAYDEQTLFLIGGAKMYPTSPYFITNDVYQTSDGLTWTKLPVPPWAPRMQFVTAILSLGNLYLMGGWPGRQTGLVRAAW